MTAPTPAQALRRAARAFTDGPILPGYTVDKVMGLVVTLLEEWADGYEQRSAAPSGETAPPDLCGHVVDGVHNDRHGAQWTELPAAAGVAAPSVPAAPNAQATPDHLPLSAIRAELDDFTAALAANDALGDGPHADYVVRISEERMEAAAWELAMKLHDALAAPSGEQPTTLDDQVDAIRREVYDNVYVNDDDGYPWLTCGLCGRPLKMVEAGDEWSELDAKVAGHDCARPAGEQPTAEPVGEVDRG